MKKLYFIFLINSTIFTNTIFSMEGTPQKKGLFQKLAYRVSGSFKKKEIFALSKKELDTWLANACVLLKIYKDSETIGNEVNEQAAMCILLGIENKEKDRESEKPMWLGIHEKKLKKLYNHYKTWSSDSDQQKSIISLMDRDKVLDDLELEKELQNP